MLSIAQLMHRKKRGNVAQVVGMSALIFLKALTPYCVLCDDFL